MSDYHRFNSLKILVHADRLREAAAGGMPYPIDWHIYPSNLCNHTCEFCIFIQNGEQKKHAVQLPKPLLLRAIDDAARTGARLVHFSGGGEPLINKATPEAMARAQGHGLKVALSTNGRLLTPDIASLVDYIRVSLNAGTEAQHTTTNHAGDGESDWHAILDAIRAAVPHKRRDFGLGFVVTHQNYEDIYEFCRVAADLGVDFVHIRPGFYYDAELDDATRRIMTVALGLSEAARGAFGHRVQIFAITDKFDGYWSPRTYDRCRAVLTGTCLTATGDFAVCQDRTDLRFGAEYRTGAAFEDVWRSDEHRRLVDSIVSPGVLDTCPRCVWNKRNELIDTVFSDRDPMRLEMV
ncbi:MAG: radical SAM protein [Bradyrhizobium sp.]|uniref:radical SAM protein n=1 Tax=Bradyrhizobium sp. TaxID=376 RepID=UPI003D128B3B